MYSTKKITMAALFATLCCVATFAVKIPIPATGGYIHPGDALVILCGIFLGPNFGFLAAGVGSAMADLLGGYFIYVPITFVIKGLVAWITGKLFQVIHKKTSSHYPAVILGGIVDMLLVCGGYFVCEIPLYGISAAAISVLPNIVQGCGGLIIAVILYPVLISIPDMRRFSEEALVKRRK